MIRIITFIKRVEFRKIDEYKNNLHKSHDVKKYINSLRLKGVFPKLFKKKLIYSKILWMFQTIYGGTLRGFFV